MKTNIIKIGIISLLGLGTVSGVVLTKQVSTHVKEATAATNLTTYYQNADTSSPTALLNSLKKGGSVTTINTLGYNGLWNAYKTTDIRSDGKICDTYSNTTNYTPGTDQDSGSHSKEGDTYNREHTIPKSWWGGTEYNQGCDIFIVYPTDSYVNGMRSNYPYGEVGTISYASNNNYSLLGSSSRSGYTGTVFEPADEWKGDFARVYFYAIATYTTTSWTTYEGSLVFESSISSPNYGLTNYAKSLFLEWNSQDPVSQWERDRNDKGQAAQGNRNPFIDHPEWADFIWNGGSLTTKTLTSISKSGSPSKTTYTAGETFNPNGLTITATYSDGSTANVTNSLSWTPSP
ncbi:MAG: endonuclease, partial [Bacilli bacterium]|nr:endonuclease [Bacilli bacterium]